MRAAEPLVSEPSCFEVEIILEKLERYKWADADQTPAELIKAGGNTSCSGIHKLINSPWNKGELP